MSQTGTFTGREGNVIAKASGKHISLKNARAVTFISQLDAGTQNVTLKESKGGASEQNLAVIDTLYKKPGDGDGTYTPVAQTAAATYDHSTDATNNQFEFTVRARELSDGFDSVEVTASAGTLVAIIHDLNVKGAPDKLLNPVVA